MTVIFLISLYHELYFRSLICPINGKKILHMNLDVSPVQNAGLLVEIFAFWIARKMDVSSKKTIIGAGSKRYYNVRVALILYMIEAMIPPVSAGINHPIS